MAVKVSLRKLAELVESLGDDLEATAIRGVQSAAYRLEGMVVESIMETGPHPPQDTGELTRSTRTDPTPRGAVVSVDAPHAPFMEHGTRPHFPPTAPLAEWALRKGIADTDEEAEDVAFAIAQKISARGIEPRHFMLRAVEDFNRRGILRREVRSELKEEAARRQRS